MPVSLLQACLPRQTRQVSSRCRLTQRVWVCEETSRSYQCYTLRNLFDPDHSSFSLTLLLLATLSSFSSYFLALLFHITPSGSCPLKGCISNPPPLFYTLWLLWWFNHLGIDARRRRFSAAKKAPHNTPLHRGRNDIPRTGIWCSLEPVTSYTRFDVVDKRFVDINRMISASCHASFTLARSLPRWW